jgi:hypothetical protein
MTTGAAAEAGFADVAVVSVGDLGEQAARHSAAATSDKRQV